MTRSPRPLWAPRASEPTGKKGAPGLVSVRDLDVQGEPWLLLHSGAEEECLQRRQWLRRLSASPCPGTEVTGKLPQPNPGRTANGPEPLGMKVWVTPPGKEPWLAEMLAKGIQKG